MAKDLYCWRCDRVIPMLDEQEWPALDAALGRGIEDLQLHRRVHGSSLKEAKDHHYGQAALDLYYAMTGFRETNPDALWHHRASLYGPACDACGKPLRTPKASFCAACGTARA